MKARQELSSVNWSLFAPSEQIARKLLEQLADDLDSGLEEEAIAKFRKSWTQYHWDTSVRDAAAVLYDNIAAAYGLSEAADYYWQ